jgi:hypothetical protein
MTPDHRHASRLRPAVRRGRGTEVPLPARPVSTEEEAA